MTAQTHWTCSWHNTGGEGMESAERHVGRWPTCSIVYASRPDEYDATDANPKGLPHSPTDDERFDQWYAAYQGGQSLDFKRIVRDGWRGALQHISDERERNRRFAAEHDGCVDRSRAENAERRCEELSREVGEWKRAAGRAEATGNAIIESREKLLHAERIVTQGLSVTIANRDAEIANLKRLLGGHTCYTPAQRHASAVALRRLMATGQSIIDIAKNGMGEGE